MIGKRLKLARKREGLSLLGLADRTNNMVSAQAIGKYEREETGPGSQVFIALSKALGVPMSYLCSPNDVSLEGVEIKKLASTKARERARVELAVLDHVDRYLQIEEILGISSTGCGELEGGPIAVRAIEDAEDAAEAVRKAWKLGDKPIFNMTQLLEERGIRILKLGFPLSVDGMTCTAHRPSARKSPIVVCSAGKSIERQRFSLAYQFGGLLLDIGENLDEKEVGHRFAGAFLAPRSKLFEKFGRQQHALCHPEIIVTKREFVISAAALTARLGQLGIISKTTLRRILSGVGREWRKIEPAPLERSEPTRRFRDLCCHALAEDEISWSKAIELLRQPVDEIERTMPGLPEFYRYNRHLPQASSSEQGLKNYHPPAL